ncbi:uncharacterized protein LOC131657689 [Vicia villosa]|uniref:uncharacterized protein LOC131657689 n=1 Tax=Vicia villosa TaxID=3911 RepID=UPI00273B9283|nr:uncharacterized protein LOC131657689 [Vicia villosa]
MMFSFTSLGGKINTSVNNGTSPPMFIMIGENYHQMGSLLPQHGSQPKFSQLSIYDTNNEVQNHMSVVRMDKDNSELNSSIVEDIKEMLDEYNSHAKVYRMARDKVQTNDMSNMKLRILGKRGYDGRRYSTIESSRVYWVKTHQKELRADMYSCLTDAVLNGETNPSTSGRRIVLPSSFTGGARYMLHNYQDAMAICRWAGYPYLFITFTCNKNWLEMQRVVTNMGLKSEDRPDLVCRIFKIKLDHIDMIKDINKGNIFGKVKSACEAAWIIFAFDINYREPSDERLSFHLENEQIVTFSDNDRIDHVVNKEKSQHSKFLTWMDANRKYPEAKELTYREFPSKFVWNQREHQWYPRKRGFQIGRLYFVHPWSGQLYYLQNLLNYCKGPTSFEDLKTVNNVVLDSFKDACYARCLIHDDREYIDAIIEASHWGTNIFLRKMFTTLLLSNQMTSPVFTWNNT